MNEIVIIAHDIRSTYNVGALLRTAECMGVQHVYLTGYTPYPEAIDDTRLPHERAKLARQIDKTALGSAELVPWTHDDDITARFALLRADGYSIVGLEQDDTSIALSKWEIPHKVALLLGREVEGIEPDVLSQCDVTVEIPQFGQKESLNVIQAAAMALYHMRFAPEK